MAEDKVFHELFELKPGKGDLQRLKIIRAAIDCVARSGFEGGTLEKIAKRIGTRRSHVAYYYPDRNELFEHVVQYIIATAQSLTVEMVKAAGTPRDRVIAICDAAFEWAEKYPEQSRVLLYFYFECALKVRYRRLNTTLRASGALRIQALIEEILKSSPQFHLRLSTEEAAKALQALMTGIVLESLSTIEPERGGLRILATKACQSWLDSVIQSR